jgi:hypothetical protein
MLLTNFARVGAAVLVVGLQIGWAQTSAKGSPDEVTFSKDVAPIFQRACQNCHRPGSIGPMSLLTYQEARPWARSIKQQVTQRNMPPWYIDRTVGIQSFKNDVSLTDGEIAKISKWVDQGSPMGDPADMPPPRKFDDSNRWHIGNPDIIVNLKSEVLVKARQADQWLDLDMQDLGVKSNRYIQAMEIKPVKGVKVVHHVESSLIDPDDESQAGRQHLEEYAVGKFGDAFPEDTGMLLKPGARILANVHLHADGEDTPVDLAIGLKLYPEGEVPKHVAHAQQLGSAAGDLDIRPNQKNIRFDGYTVLTKPAVITAFQPHMHVRGQAQCLELIIPQKTAGDRPAAVKTDTASCVDRFKFDWHVVYEYADDVAPIVPAGTILHVISFYDNTNAHRGNPDPSNWTGYGNRTIDEMGFSWINWYYITEDEYKQAIARRESTAGATSGSQQ